MHPVELRQGGVRELEAQHDQGGDDPIGKHQIMVGAGAFGAEPVAAPAFAQPRLLLGDPRVGQLSNELGQSAPGDTGEDTMRQGRAGQS